MATGSTFPKPQSAGAGVGHDYEKANCMRLLQKLEEQNEQFSIANNVDKLGDFDDIVCKIVHDDGKIQFLFLQLKYAINDDKIITDKEKTKSNKIIKGDSPLIIENIIKKSFTSFKKVLEISENRSSETQKLFQNLFDRNLSECDTEFVYFTIREISEDVEKNFQPTSNVSNLLKSILSESGKCFEIPGKQTSGTKNINFHQNCKEFEYFRQNFKFCVAQMKREELEEKIKDNLTDYKKETVFNGVKEIVNQWYLQLGTAVQSLSLNNHLFNNYTTLLYKQEILRNLKTSCNIIYNNDYMKQLTDEKKIIFRFFSQDDDMIMYTTLIKQLFDYLQNYKISKDNEMIVINENVDVELLRRMLQPKCSIKRLAIIFEKNAVPENKNSDFMQIVEQFNDRNETRVLVISNSNTYHEIKNHEFCNSSITEFSINQLNETSQNKISEKMINFQGVDVSFETLFSQHPYKNDVQIISKLAQNKECSIGNNLEIQAKVPVYYMPRFFVTNNINYFLMFLNRNENDDYFVLFVKNDVKFNKNLVNDSKCKIIENESVFNDKCVDIAEHRNIHLFEYNEKSIKYKKSRGAKTNIEKYLKENDDLMISEKDLVDHYINPEPDNRFIIISDIPGNGKSTTLKNLALNLKEKYKHMYIVVIDLNAIKIEFDNLNTTIDSNNALDFISKYVLKNQNKELLKSFCDIAEKSIILIDAYDEIVANYERSVQPLIRSLLQTKAQNIIITTRPHCLESVHDALEKRAAIIHMSKFDEKTQEKFLVAIWNHNIKEQNVIIETENLVEKCAKTLVDFVHGSENSNFKEITGIPLLLTIFSEIQLEKVIECDTSGKDLDLGKTAFSFLQLYEDYFEHKLRILLREKYLGTEKTVFKILEQKVRTDTIESHVKLSCQEIFSIDIAYDIFDVKKDLFNELSKNDKITPPEQFGLTIKQDRSYIFLHRTFAEYFCATEVIHVMKTQPDRKFMRFLISELLLKQEYFVVRTFLNDALGRCEEEVENAIENESAP